MNSGLALDVRSVVDALRAELQSRIVRGAIPPGAPLAEEAIAQSFDVARPTAKAAIEQLVHLGLLRRLPNKTARVPLLEESDVADLYLSRGAIEQAAVLLLAGRGEAPAKAEAALERLRAAIAQGDKVIDVVDSDIEFHRALIESTGSPRLKRLHEAVIGEAHLCMAQVQLQHLLDPAIIAEEHKRILATIRKGDPERAAQQMAAHLARAQNKLAQYLRRRGEAASTTAADAPATVPADRSLRTARRA